MFSVGVVVEAWFILYVCRRGFLYGCSLPPVYDWLDCINVACPFNRYSCFWVLRHVNVGVCLCWVGTGFHWCFYVMWCLPFMVAPVPVFNCSDPYSPAYMG